MTFNKKELGLVSVPGNLLQMSKHNMSLASQTPIIPNPWAKPLQSTFRPRVRLMVVYLGILLPFFYLVKNAHIHDILLPFFHIWFYCHFFIFG